MSSLDHRSDLPRLLRFSFALACAASLMLASSTKADTILAFSQQYSTDVITATESGGVTTLSTAGNSDGDNLSIPVLASSYLGVTQPLGLAMYETFLGSGLTSTNTATSSGGTISQNYTGTVEFTQNADGSGIVYLIATFSGPTGTFSGGAGGGSASLNASVPSDTVTFTVPYNVSNPGSGLSYANEALSLQFSNITPGLSTAGGSVAPFTAQGSGTLSASVVPEPSSLCLASIAAVIGTIGYTRRKGAKS